ncbi:MAG: YegS/Rv2252/BmrU family lipid kinase [Synechococcales bacterium]|nr:YegS/Rv2252/BmrU family lipid kinase [Synechococcales bacterium]
MSPRVCLIFVPVAGHAKAGEDLLTIRGILTPFVVLDIYVTTVNMGAGQIAQRVRDHGFDLIVAAGGDGTVSEVANVMAGTYQPVGILPQGTANVFARRLEIPTDLRAACRTLLTGGDRYVDVVLCNDQPMIASLSIGFEAEAIATLSQKEKKRWGIWAYPIAQVKQLWGGLRPFEAEIEVEGEKRIVSASAITVANTVSRLTLLAQGPSRILPDDGQVSVTIIDPKSRLSAIVCGFVLLWAGLFQRSAHHPAITYFRACHLRVETTTPQAVILDGDPIDSVPFDIRCRPRSLRVVVPAQAGE